jgi:hypothetical protein
MMTNPLVGATLLITWPMVIAQTSGSTTDVTQIVTLVSQIGLSAVFLWQWRDERGERRKNAADMLLFMQRFGPTLESAVTTIEMVQKGLSASVEKVQQAIPSPSDNDLALRRLEMVADDLRMSMRERERWEPGMPDRRRGER